MDHTARFAADSLRKQYPEPDRLPEDACLVFVRDGGVYIRTGSAPTICEKVSSDLPGGLKRNARYLGHRGSVPWYAIDLTGDLPLPEGLAYSGVRELAGLLPDEELAIAGLAVQIIDYDRTTRFCGRCGTATEPARTERAKVCPSCHRVMYPRLSPAVIVLVRNNNSVLMVRGKRRRPAGTASSPVLSNPARRSSMRYTAKSGKKRGLRSKISGIVQANRGHFPIRSCSGSLPITMGERLPRTVSRSRAPDGSTATISRTFRQNSV